MAEGALLVLGSVCFGGIEEARLSDFEEVTVAIDLLEKAGLVAGMAGAAGLFHFKKERVHVTISVEFDYFLRVAAGFSLEPELLARAAPVVHETGVQSGLKRCRVHPCHHEDTPGGRVLNDRGNEAVRGEFQG